MFRKKNKRDEISAGINQIYPRLWRYCLSLSSNPDRANDLAQATCLKALEKAELFELGTHQDRWMFRIAQRLWINEMRSEAVRRGGGLVTIDEVELPDTKNSDQETNLFAREVLMKVMELPEAQRATVMLVYVEGFSYKEASEILEIPIGTIMSRLATSRQKLAAYIEDMNHKVGK
jgi:RNA polymerase sigma-70 factor (ECF subfamily)